MYNLSSEYPVDAVRVVGELLDQCNILVHPLFHSSEMKVLKSKERLICIVSLYQLVSEMGIEAFGQKVKEA
jgi:hypothetical protein